MNYDTYTCYCTPNESECETCVRVKTCLKKWQWEHNAGKPKRARKARTIAVPPGA